MTTATSRDAVKRSMTTATPNGVTEQIVDIDGRGVYWRRSG